MSLNIADFKTTVLRRISNYIENPKDILVESQESYDYLRSIGLEVGRLENKPGVFYIGDIKCFSYESYEEVNGKVVFYNIELFENDLVDADELAPGKYSAAYYHNTMKPRCTGTVYVINNGEDVGKMEFEMEYEEAFKRGCVEDIKRAINQIMSMLEYEYTIQKAVDQGKDELAELMYNMYGMYAPPAIAKALELKSQARLAEILGMRSLIL